MVHTLPDYTTKYKMTTIFGNIDTGELAARLGSIDIFDRRGNVIWMDDFEGTVFKWDVTAGGGGGAAVLDNTYVLQGSQSAKMTSGTTTASPTKIKRTIAYPVLGRLGFEVACSHDTVINTITFRMLLYTGSKMLRPKIEFNPLSDVLSLWDETGAKQTVSSSVKMVSGENTFHRIKLVVDYITEKYVRIIVNNQVFDVSSYGVQDGASANDPRLIVEIWDDGLTGQDSAVYIDSAIITQNEPGKE